MTNKPAVSDYNRAGRKPPRESYGLFKSKHESAAVERTAKPLSLCQFAVGSLLLHGAATLCLAQVAFAQAVRPTEADFRAAKEQVTSAPKDFKAHFDLAELYKRNGNLKDAPREYALSTELNPSSHFA